MRTALPRARATRATVDSRTSLAWFSSREIADFFVWGAARVTLARRDFKESLHGNRYWKSNPRHYRALN